jgi:hypothetical protein
MTEQVWEALDLDAVVSSLRDCPARWWIAGGYALELFLGRFDELGRISEPESLTSARN